MKVFPADLFPCRELFPVLAVLLSRRTVDDQFLIRQIIKGNTETFRFLVLRYQRPLFKFLSTFQLERSIVEEIAQETFVRAFESISTFDPKIGASFSSWLFTIGKNLALNERSRARRKFETYDEEAIKELPEVDDSALEKLELAEKQKLLAEALNSLPDPFGNTVRLSYLKEISIDDIARMENCSVGTVKSRIFRGKKMLRALLVQKAECS